MIEAGIVGRRDKGGCTLGVGVWLELVAGHSKREEDGSGCFGPVPMNCDIFI
jgi:hypothetical protein